MLVRCFTLIVEAINEVVEIDTLPGESLADSLSEIMDRSTLRPYIGAPRRFFEDFDIVLAQEVGTERFEWLTIACIGGTWSAIELAGPPCNTVGEIATQLAIDPDCCASCGTEDVGRFGRYNAAVCDDCVESQHMER